MGNATASTWIPNTSDADEVADQIFVVFMGLAFVAFVCVMLSYTVVASTLREMSDWAQRTSRAEMQLSEATGLPTSACGAFRADGILDDEDEDELIDPPLLRRASQESFFNTFVHALTLPQSTTRSPRVTRV